MSNQKKLSEVLQEAIDKGFYQYQKQEFMCHALRDMLGDMEALPYQTAILKRIYPKGTLCGFLPEAERNWSYRPGPGSERAFEICKAWYLNWIKELKEQGL